MKSKIREKAKKIKAVLFDVDGVLTDGGIIYDNSGNEIKRFNVKDGMIVKYLQKYNIKVGVITGRSSPVAKKRCDELKLDFQAHGISTKINEYNRFKETYQILDEQIAFIGDDINDLPIITQCGLSASPYDARGYIKSHVDLVMGCKGGEGVLRDFADIILDAQGKLTEIIAEQTGENYG